MLASTVATESIPVSDIAILDSLSSPHPSPEQVAADAVQDVPQGPSLPEPPKKYRHRCGVCSAPQLKKTEMCSQCRIDYRKMRELFRSLNRREPYQPRVYTVLPPG